MVSRLDIIDQALQFIEAHLRDHITVMDIADHCGYSLFHFIRLFNHFACQTPYDYLIRRRLSESLKDLRDTSRSITDLTYDYCFETPESFSRAFKRVFGLLPSSYRAGQPLAGCLPIPPRSRRDLEYIQRGDFLHPQLISINDIKVAGLTVMADDPSQHGLFAHMEQLNTALSLNGLVKDHSFFNITSFDDNPFNPAYQFMGVAVESTAYPPPVTIQHIPSGRYVRHAYDQPDRKSALRYLFFTWLPRARILLSDRFLIEEYLYVKKQDVNTTILVPVNSVQSVVALSDQVFSA